ncbi:hypothetical protein, partial [Clostridium sp. CAG:265]
MKRDKIIEKIREFYKHKKNYYITGGSIITIAFLGTIIVKPSYIEKTNFYIKSLIDGDPNYEQVKEKVALYAFRKEISLKEFKEGTIVKKEDEVKGPITASAIKSGFDSFTPSEVPKDDTTTETSTYSNNTLNNGSSSNNYYVEEKPSYNNNNNNNNISSGNGIDKNETI